MTFTNDALWTGRAACRDGNPDDWFEPSTGGQATSAHLLLQSRVVAVCRACPVRADCLQYAIDNGERFGIWGGLTAAERRAERLSRKKAS